MLRINKLSIGFLAFTALWTSSFAASTSVADRVQYEFTFDALWNPDDHPGFPANGHFSGVYGVAHSEDYQLWQPGELASPGIQQIAELGSSTLAKVETAEAIEAGTVLREIGASGRSLSPYTVSSRFTIFPSHPLVSAATMLAPSPDWFLGVHDLSLLDEQGNWIPEISVDLVSYDAGTDSGVDFRSANEVTDPAVPIFRIAEDPLPTEFSPLGRFTFTLLSVPGDIDGSGVVDAGDIQRLCSRIGRDEPNIDQAGNPNLIELEDVHAIAERVLGTAVGDTDLDGTVGFDDFLTLSGNFGDAADWTGGDFDCNGQAEFADFLSLSENFGFTQEVASTASVPEPSAAASGAAMGSAMLSFVLLRRRARYGKV